MKNAPFGPIWNMNRSSMSHRKNILFFINPPHAEGAAHGSLAGLSGFFRLFFCLVFVFLFSLPAYSATSLEKTLATEKQKAATRQASLKRLTADERKANANLAAAEKKVLEIEKNLAERQKKLMNLASQDKTASTQYAALVKERERTEAAQAEVLRLLWEITCYRESVGGREMTDWAGVDRNYTWSKDIYGALDKYRKDVAEQERKIANVVSKRNKLAAEIQKDLDAVNAEKTKLLQERLKYNQQLADVRKQKQDTESELVSILKLVEDLNIKVERAEADKRAAREKAEAAAKAREEAARQAAGKKPAGGQQTASGGKGATSSQKAPDAGPAVGSMAGLKGKLPYPVKGSVKRRFAPGANPPVRGLGFGTVEKASVYSVAAGKVVHNDILRGFGNVVIIMHGSDYYSLYAFLTHSPVQVGQSVKARQIIGSTGFYPAINGPGLYFELRFHQQAINPAAWFAKS